MKTCNDCIHSEVCIDVNADYSSESKGEYDDCTEFKDTAKFIELPCLVGDTVWTIMYNTIIEAKIICIKPLIRNAKENQFKIVAAITDRTSLNGRLLGHEVYCELGEDTFFAREDAEKKLEALK